MSGVGWVFLAAVLMVGAALAVVTRCAGPAASPPSPARPAALLVPVAGVARAALVDDWGEPRGGGRPHRGLDIPAPAGTPVLAAADGTVAKLFASRLGGPTLYQRSADGRWIFYYAHLAGYAAGMAEGRAIRAGEVVGYVGDTGDAGPGNYHLHFGLARARPGDGWWQGEDVDPFLYLAGRRPAR